MLRRCVCVCLCVRVCVPGHWKAWSKSILLLSGCTLYQPDLIWASGEVTAKPKWSYASHAKSEGKKTLIAETCLQRKVIRLLVFLFVLFWFFFFCFLFCERGTLTLCFSGKKNCFRFWIQTALGLSRLFGHLSSWLFNDS